MHGCKILTRLLVAHGSAYTTKFSSKSGGFTIIASRIKRFWSKPAIWMIALCLLFGYDVVDIDLDGGLDTALLLNIFSRRRVVYPDALVITTSLLQQGLNDIIRSDDESERPPNKSAVKSGNASSDNLAEALQARCMFELAV